MRVVFVLKTRWHHDIEDQVHDAEEGNQHQNKFSQLSVNEKDQVSN